MSWFDEQIQYRKLKDEEVLSEAYTEIAGAILGRKLSQAWQNEQYAAESALEEICRFYHVRKREIPASITELNRQLDYVFQPAGIARRIVKLKTGWQKNAVGAMLGIRKADGKPVALLPGKTGGYTMPDMERGKQVRVTDKAAQQLEDEAFVFYRPFPQRSITLKEYLKYMYESLDTSDLIMYFGIMGIITLLGLLIPKINHMLFAEVVEYGSTQLLLAVMSFLMCITVSTQLFSSMQEAYLSRINMKLSLSVQAATMMRILSLPTDFFRDYTSGELKAHVQHMNSLCSLIINGIFSVGITGVFSLVYIAQIFRYARALVVPVMIVLVLSLALTVITAVMQIRVSKRSMDLNAKEQGMVYSLINGIQKIRLSGAENRAFARWGKLYAKEAKSLYEIPVILKYSSVFSAAIALMGTVFMYYAAVKSNVSVADYFAFNSAYAYVATAFAAVGGIVKTTASIKPILEIVDPLLKAEPEINEEKEVVTRLTGKIELSHVTFAYPGSDRKILDDVSLRINPGQYVAVVGRTGCGKSTLMRILLGFEKPQKGAVYYDGKDMDKLDLRSLRRKIGVVLQNGKLVNDDIFSNITISAPWLTLDDAWQAAEIAGIADDIREMPMGMQTIVQAGSGGFSGGQKQRIMIARAVAAKPKILLLDEATSALDNITQKHVSEAMDKMKCTRIVIAHRLSTIRQCDRIIVLDNGGIIEDGTYDELINAGGFFAEMVQRQRI